ncbi:unnamed protein product [Nyctereutes procyonoides]|uniref:(raccoon dog) hypothetical protein n=1 Tax=Nyctereutes procyonoides TaxID=34880 RepID=A0A811ZPG0_NYCPR|nr:unnamed protein product [Nyctereutes procyonoides]
MTSPEMDVQIHFTDIKKHFNSYTLTGIALMILYFKLRSTKAPTVKAT